MKQTNYQLFDFLDFSTSLDGSEVLWKACKPTAIEKKGSDILLTVPFQKQIISNDIVPDKQADCKEYQLRIRSYGDKIIRLSIGINQEIRDFSPMIEMHKDLSVSPIFFEKEDKQWIVTDTKGQIKVKINQAEHRIEHWSNLLPAPEESPDISIFPDGKKVVKIHTYDQFFPARHDAMALAFVEKNGKPHRITTSFHVLPDEKFVGTGERFTKMDLSGHTFQLKNQDGQGVNNRRTYKNIPFYISSKGYGIFLHTSAYAKFSLADHSTRSAQILAEEPLLDIFLIGGDNLEEIIFQYRQLTGFPSLPPLWSFGIWMSRMTYFSADEVNEICDRLRQEDFPCDVIHLDTGWFRTDWLCEWKFNPERFPDPKGFITGLKEKGFRVSLWQMPYIAANAEQHDEAVSKNYIGPLDKTKTQGGSNFSALDYAGTIDFTYPDAVEWYKGLLRNLLEMGVVCIKTDFGEEIHLDATYYGMSPELLNNLYALLYQKAAFEITKKVTGDGIIWARAGWAGCQRYPLHWGGDAACSWDGMAGTLKGGLHLGLSGFGFWSHDVPGFHGIPDFMNTVIPHDLYLRWTQFGVFTSHIRYHGTSKREPYDFPEIADIVRKWWRLRYALIPYIWQQSRKTTQTGYPVLRALIFHHPDDKVCWHIDDEYYFGDNFLVAPVMNSENIRDIYLPEGKWINFFHGEITEGGRWIKDYNVPLEEMPVWVKYNSIIPLYPQKINCTDEIDMNALTSITINEKFKGIFTWLFK